MATATVNIDIPVAKELAARAASGETPYAIAGWQADCERHLARAVEEAGRNMKGWRRKNTDVAMSWSGVNGWAHSYQTYWER